MYAAHYGLSKTAIQALSNDPNVAYMSLDRPVKGMLDITASSVHSDTANQSGYDGTGIGVAIIDSGIASLPDFNGSRGSRVAYSQTYVGSSASDQFGHGTHVAGIIGANGWTSKYRGIAPNVNLVNFRVLDQNGMGTDSAVIAAIDQAIRLSYSWRYNVRVINLSLGRPVYEPVAQDLVPGCRTRLAGRHCRGGIRGQQRPRRLGWRKRLWHHQLARQRSLRHHRRGHEDDGHQVSH